MVPCLLIALAVTVGGTRLATTNGNDHLPETMGWEQFKLRFGKDAALAATTDTADRSRVEAKRRAAFESSVAAIVAHNIEADRGRYSFRLGVNEYSDLTPAEYRQQLLGLRHGGGWQRPRPIAPADSAAADPPPTSVDWRTQNAVTPVKNQGQCGACCE